MERGSRSSPTLSSQRTKAPKIYVVFEGREKGIYGTWEDCAARVNGYSHNVHRSFKSPDEAESAFKAYERGKVGSSASKGEGKQSFVQSDIYGEVLD